MAGGGAERGISVLANGLVLRGADVSILMIADDTVSYPLDPRIHLSAVSVGRTGGSLRKRFMRIRRMRRYFAEHPDSTIIAFGPDVSIFTALSELGQGHRLIFSERNDPAAFPHAFARNLAYGRADVMVFQTLQARDYFGAKLRTRGKVIANPVRRDLPDSLYISQGAERCRTGRIAAVGRLEPQKNHMLLLDAFRRFLCANPSAHRRQVYRLHLYGSGSLLAALESRAKALGTALRKGRRCVRAPA